MESPKGKNSHFVRCLKCGKILQCSRYDTMALLDHIRKSHPEIIITDEEPKHTTNNSDGKKSPNYVDFAAQDEIISIKSEPVHLGNVPSNDLPEIKVCMNNIEENNMNSIHSNGSDKNEGSSINYTQRNRTRMPQQSNRGNLYRTSIERWRPANGTIYCPKCGCNKRPLVKTHTERLTGNTCCATCILTCWPFCFLPFLFPGQNKEYLHCANCKTFLGLYDRDNNCIKPNREYVDNMAKSSSRPK